LYVQAFIPAHHGQTGSLCLLRVIRFALAPVYFSVHFYSFLSIAVSAGLDWDVTNGCGNLREATLLPVAPFPPCASVVRPNTFSATLFGSPTPGSGARVVRHNTSNQTVFKSGGELMEVIQYDEISIDSG
jgi:hypothetical protein